MSTISVGDVVEFVEPTADEMGTLFRVVELRGERVLVELSGWVGSIAPTFVYRADELRAVPTLAAFDRYRASLAPAVSDTELV
jgi:hypothetical protein